MERAALNRQQTSEWPAGEALEVAARYVAQVRSSRGMATRVQATACKPGLAALGQVMRSVPVVHAPFSQTAAGDELCNWFRPRRVLPLDRTPVAMLPLPVTHADYLRGRSQQALRTNLARAAEAGIVCTAPESPLEVWRSAELIAGRRGQRVEDIVRRRPRGGLLRHFCIAYDPAGGPVGLAETIVDGEWAGLAVLVSTSGHPDAQLIRYRLHDHVVGRLIGDGVSTLVVGGSTLLTSHGTRYFQRRTGFLPVWLRPAPRVTAGIRRRTPPAQTPLTLADLVAAVPASAQEPPHDQAF